MRRLAEMLPRLAASDLPVLIYGETGTGKEIVARAIHRRGPRRAQPFVVVDCASIPPNLFEVEIFGALEGAFTDQREGRQGLLRGAGGGSVLFDEIGALSLDCQAKLLRVLSAHTVRPVGGGEEIPIDVRFLFASRISLSEGVREGRFRDDLLHRIDVVSVEVPPLRQRPEDLPDLVVSLAKESGKVWDAPAGDVLHRLRAHPWHGNVRELRNLVARLVIEGSNALTLETVERGLGEDVSSVLFPRGLLMETDFESLKTKLEREYIVLHFRRFGCDTLALQRFLNVSERQLYRRCSRLGIRLREERMRWRRRSK